MIFELLTSDLEESIQQSKKTTDFYRFLEEDMIITIADLANTERCSYIYFHSYQLDTVLKRLDFYLDKCEIAFTVSHLGRKVLSYECM